jgi:hypothetical protein
MNKMTNTASSSTAQLQHAPLVHRFALWGLVLIDVWLLGKLTVAAVTKAYAIDEFYYAHKAWVAAQSSADAMAMITGGSGFVTTLVMAPFAMLGADDPSNMILLRVAMLPVFLAIVALIAGITIRRLRTEYTLHIYLLTVLLALSTYRLAWHGVEIRPDVIGLFFALLSVRLLDATRLSDRVAATAAGLMLFLGCFVSVKVFVYGAVMAPAFVIDLWSWYRGRPQLLRSVWFIAAGFGFGLAVLLLFLLAAGKLGSLGGHSTRAYASIRRCILNFPPRVFSNPSFRTISSYLALPWLESLRSLSAQAVPGKQKERFLVTCFHFAESNQPVSIWRTGCPMSRSRR